MASLSSFPTNSPTKFPKTSIRTSSIFVSNFKLREFEQTHFRLWPSFKKIYSVRLQTTMQSSELTPRDKGRPALRVKALCDSPGLTQERTNNTLNCIAETEMGNDMFGEMKQRFLSFKKQKCLENLEHFQNLAKAQAPKFLVIACADSRVCPSHVLGFQPGEAFIVRNVGNLVPPFENGPTETNAALEFAVNSLEVENILVIGHSCCGGMRALMSMQEEEDPSFIRSWVIVGKNARLNTKAVASNLNFDQQCRYCEKESINHSLLNLLTYPWIEKRVNKGVLSVHGGYYDFVDCTFEKWTLDYKGNNSMEKSSGYSIKNRDFWC